MQAKFKLIILAILIYGLPIFLFAAFPFGRKIYPNFELFQSPILTWLTGKKIEHSSLGILFDAVMVYCFWILGRKNSNINLEEERLYKIFTGIKKIFRAVFLTSIKDFSLLTKDEKVSLLFYLVKLFWAPLMLIFAIENVSSFVEIYNKYAVWNFDAPSIINLYFPLYVAAIFSLDTIIFSFGYIVESKSLKNVVKSVEPTALGWISALVCYGPFFDTFTRFAGSLPQDFADFGNININIIAGISTIIFFSIYVWASVSLGFKASNLTNRGIVTTGAYKYVRHPAYAAKNIGWLLASVPLIKIMGFKALINVLIWMFVYYVRAITEERHLSQDPDYLEYKKQVRHMFIPGLY